MREEREQREGWDRAGIVIGLVVALVIMWGALAISIVGGDEGGGSSGTGKLIYEQPDPAEAADDDDAGR